MKAIETAEKNTTVAKKARASAESKFAKQKVQLGGTELKLGKAQSLNATLAKELVDLKATLETCENKWYNEGFADAENSAKSVIR